MAQPLSGLETTTSGIAEPITITSVTSNKNALDVASYPVSGVYVERYDYASSTTIYVGIAIKGSSESANVWTITKYDLVDNSNASAKSAINVAWDDRATETYS